MSRTTKIVLGIIGGLFLVCCIGAVAVALMLPRMLERFAENNFTDDPERAAEVGRSIVDYDLPSGIVEEGAMSFVGMKMVFLTTGEQDGGVIMLMQFPAALQMSDADMQAQMQEALSQQTGSDQNMQFQVVKTEEVVINDKQTVLTTMEGTDENGNAIRQATAVFESKNGEVAMLMAMSPVASWDSANIDEFIESLR